MQGKVKVYQYKVHKLLIALLGPLLIALLLWLFLFALPPKTKIDMPISVKLFFAAILASIYVIPVIYLIYRHWKYGRQARLYIEGGRFSLEWQQSVLVFDKTAVNAINCFTTISRTPWGWGCWWELIIEGKVYYLSCLVVPRSVMERYFSKKIVEKKVVWPDIRMDKLLLSIEDMAKP
jgi:hypothetical protein